MAYWAPTFFGARFWGARYWSHGAAAPVSFVIASIATINVVLRRRGGRMFRNREHQAVGAQLVSTTDGSAFTGTATVYVTIDAGTQVEGQGSVVHEGNGYHTYTPTRAETIGNLIAFTFTGSGAMPETITEEPV